MIHSITGETPSQAFPRLNGNYHHFTNAYHEMAKSAKLPSQLNQTWRMSEPNLDQPRPPLHQHMEQGMGGSEQVMMG